MNNAKLKKGKISKRKNYQKWPKFEKNAKIKPGNRNHCNKCAIKIDNNKYNIRNSKRKLKQKCKTKKFIKNAKCAQFA